MIIWMLLNNNLAYCGRFASAYPCNDIGRTCASKGERIIDGEKVYRDCWQWSYTKTCNYPSKNNCAEHSGCYFVAKALWRLTINPVYHQEIAMYIASTTGVSLAQINVGTQAIAVTHMWDMLYPRDSQNVVYNIHLRDGGWYEGCSLKASSVTFHYQYRSGSEICMEWVDEWDEVCGLES